MEAGFTSIRIAAGRMAAEIAPALGGSVLRLERTGPSAPIPILLDLGADPARPTDRAMFPMLPWCNRVSGAGLPFAGRVYPLPALVPDQRLPIHGLALHRAWDVLDAGSSTCALRLVDRSCPPFAYEAVLQYRVDEDGFSAVLDVTHLGDDPAPYGIGFHPWLARDPGDRLAFRAVAYVAEDENRLPIGVVSVIDDPHRDFSSARPLPSELINGTYLGWDGRATLERGLGITVTVAGRGDTSEQLHLFSRSVACGFVCLEPTSHTGDSENRPMGASTGLRVLRSGEVISGGVFIAVAE